jgi:hypothetical protein
MCINGRDELHRYAACSKGTTSLLKTDILPSTETLTLDIKAMGVGPEP